MTTKANQEIAQKKQQHLIDNIAMLLKEYASQVDEYRNQASKKIIDKMTGEEKKEISDDIHHTHQEFLSHFNNILLITSTLVNRLDSPDIFPDNVVLLDKLKETIEKIDQLVRDKYLPTRLHKIHEAIKTLLRNLIALFAPLAGSQLINKDTQTLTSTRSTLFSEIKSLKKSLTAISEPQTEAAMIGLPQAEEIKPC